MSEIRNPKKPSERDLKILEWMDEGNTIDSARALGLFKTTGLRDALYRLRKAGYIIFHKDISYKTKEGENKYYRQWFTKKAIILESGQKVENPYNKVSEIPVESEIKPMVGIKDPKPIQATLFY